MGISELRLLLAIGSRLVGGLNVETTTDQKLCSLQYRERQNLKAIH
jgi:hypothetical protein